MNDDAELLRRYTEEKSEAAFAELVQRHLGLVYHAALRQCGGDTHRAQDVSQMVFIDLARKAATLTRRPVLAGWLYTSTRYAAVQTMRTERRRQAREQEVHIMNELLSDSAPAADWEQLRPLIDDSLGALNEPDREAVLLRFFEGRSLAEVGGELCVTEDAARVRVNRALEKMHGFLSRRGVGSTLSALSLALAQHASAAAPAGLAPVVTAAAITAAAKSGLLTGWAFSAWGKMQLGLLVVVLGAGATAVILRSGDRVVPPSETAVVSPARAERDEPRDARAFTATEEPRVLATHLPSDKAARWQRPAPVSPVLGGGREESTRDEAYRLSSGDQISCSVEGEPQLAVNQIIDRKGVARLYWIGDLKLTGLTLKEAEQVIAKVYRERKILATPVVTLVVTAFAAREVLVIGAVRSPGTVSVPKNAATLDIVEVIAQAGGFNPGAETARVRVMHLRPDGVEDVSEVNVESLMAVPKPGGPPKTLFPIYPGDRVTVGLRLF